MSERIQEAYTQDTIQVLEGLEPVRKDRDVYQLYRLKRAASFG